MVSVASDHRGADRDEADRYVSPTVRQSVKILVSGPFGVGKTSLIDSVSEIVPLHTEEQMTQQSLGVDSLTGVERKTSTTVALDFGRITLGDDIVLYLYGTPGQRRFWDHWAGLAEGAIGALVLVDTRRLEESFEVFDQMELSDTPFAVAVNVFPDTPDISLDQIVAALDLPTDTPMTSCRALDRQSSIQALITLVEHATVSSRLTGAHR
ncbi:GTP-binding protein [Frankia gtarii]|uniref:GTP-binding protein n=1 Tax=Frankia gtarii TaxID=2950102 RepID=UPI0021C0F247|nr:ATP/GTP-binding protein [Frankia gtarii]